MRPFKIVLAFASTVGAVFLGLQSKTVEAQSCGQCACYYPNENLYGIKQSNDCKVCSCWVS